MSSEQISASSTGSVLDGDALAPRAWRFADRLPRRALPAQGRRAAAVLAGALGSLALALMVLASLAYVAIVASRPSILSPPSYPASRPSIVARHSTGFPAWLSGPLGPLGTWLTPSDQGRKILLTALVAGMFIAYLVVLACAASLRPRWALGAVVALELIFFLSPPLSLTDVFNYVNYGRMEVLYGLNPYTTIPALGPHTDLSYHLSNWHALLSPYGPLFTIFTFALVPLGVAASFWVLKATLLAASLACLWLVWRCAKLLGRDPLKATLFVGLNPLVLVWGLGGDHNDFFMMLLVLLAVYLLLEARARRPPPVEVGGRASTSRRLRLLAAVDGSPRPLPAGEPGPAREVTAGFLLVAAVAIKASAGLLLPVLLCGVPRRLRLLAGVVAGAVVFGAASLYAFGPTLPNLAQQSTLVTLVGLPNVLGNLLGPGGETDAMKLGLDVLLLAAVLAASVWAWRTRNWLVAAGAATLALLATLSWTLPWYVLWLLPFAALVRGRTLRVGALVVSLYLMLAWIPLMPDLIHSIGFKPSLTELGQKRQVKTLTLLH